MRQREKVQVLLRAEGLAAEAADYRTERLGVAD